MTALSVFLVPRRLEKYCLNFFIVLLMFVASSICFFSQGKYQNKMKRFLHSFEIKHKWILYSTGFGKGENLLKQNAQLSVLVSLNASNRSCLVICLCVYPSFTRRQNVSIIWNELNIIKFFFLVFVLLSVWIIFQKTFKWKGNKNITLSDKQLSCVFVKLSISLHVLKCTCLHDCI